ncbi:ATP-binding cassette domain-containing protein [Edwardsiella piscicida]|uniref:ATP-binding cassette domain-containing protein n=1 Tax=Edwardsiella piscicida TaxID=1263550 RepID=UPI00290DC144|nr:ATP-binding cassette domain-containing protein [Edwardsiella piscicida]ELM3722579.1 ATP-binding cassette domain-containing protein [Edwardsiella piscicida]ELM3727791.1 ATP-binding cassette domain-containing protein [Edwardsiella piscicida]ELV7534675.1 ATP-binding cassette domain-containing protein [Edwardsiella piscicida]
MATLNLNQLRVELAGRPLLAPLTLTVSPGEIVTLMGPSGCGKSTLLAGIGGHLQPPLFVRGEVWLDRRSLSRLPPWQRGIGLLFQDDVLFPHLTVAQNLHFALPPGASKAAVTQALQQAELTERGDCYPAALSGGQRARISVLRTLLAAPSVLLLDEPFSRLDAPLRRRFRRWVYQQIAGRAVPAILVTHDRADVPPGGRIVTLAAA